LVLAWPVGAVEWLLRLLRLLVAIALLLVVLALDTPWSMAAWLWDVQLKTHEPGRASPLLWRNFFLDGDGRLALGLIAGVVAMAVAERGVQRWRLSRSRQLRYRPGTRLHGRFTARRRAYRCFFLGPPAVG
jgi:hypothetical protein